MLTKVYNECWDPNHGGGKVISKAGLAGVALRHQHEHGERDCRGDPIVRLNVPAFFIIKNSFCGRLFDDIMKLAGGNN